VTTWSATSHRIRPRRLAKLGVTHNFTSTQIAKALALTNDIRAKYMHAD